MVAGVFAGNISAEATTPTGNTLDEATRGWGRRQSSAKYTVLPRADRDGRPVWVDPARWIRAAGSAQWSLPRRASRDP